jgi:hypothetical protein
MHYERRNYIYIELPQPFREAQKAHNGFRVSEVFETLCNEVGIPDSERDKMQAATGKALAELLENQGNGPEAKRL